MPPLPLTVVIAARNEEANIARCLAALDRAARVIVVDSGSTDATARVAAEHGAEVVQFTYVAGGPKKRQWALDHIAITDPWILLIDADEVVPPRLWTEIANAIARPDAPAAFLVTKGFHFLGRRFRFGGFSHAAVLLFRRGHAEFERLADGVGNDQDMEVHERLIVRGKVGRLRAPLVHDDRKGLEAYRARHRAYAEWEAGVRHRFLSTGVFGDSAIVPRLFGNTQERRRFLKRLALRVPGEPAAWFIYHYVLRLGFLEGRAGLLASRIRAGYIADVRRRVRSLAATPWRRVVLLNRFYWPDVTATAQMLTDLAEDLAAAGWDVTVVTSGTMYGGGRADRPRRESKDGVAIVRVGGTALGRHRPLGRMIDSVTYMLGAAARLVGMRGVSIVVAMSDPPLLIAVAALAGRLRGARVVHWVQDLYPQIAASLGVLNRGGALYRAIDAVARSSNARCDLVIALGPRMRDEAIAAGAPSSRTKVIHNWADAAAIRPVDARENDFLREHALDGKFVVLYSGNAGRSHAFDEVVGAMRGLRADPRIVFLFIGGGKRWDELRSAAARDRLANVRFLDYVPRDRLRYSLSAASVSLVSETSRAAGLLVPSKAYGILASGRPILYVGPRESDIAELIRRERCGVVVAPGSSEAVASAIRGLCDAPETRQAMGERARRAAVTVYDRRIATGRWNTELSAIASQPGPIQGLSGAK